MTKHKGEKEFEDIWNKFEDILRLSGGDFWEKDIKEMFDVYVDEVLCRALPNEPYARIKYPIEYAEWQRDVSLVREIVYERMKDNRWYHEFSDEINKLVAITCLATKFVNKVVEEEKKEREKLLNP